LDLVAGFFAGAFFTGAFLGAAFALPLACFAAISSEEIIESSSSSRPPPAPRDSAIESTSSSESAAAAFFPLPLTCARYQFYVRRTRREEGTHDMSKFGLCSFLRHVHLHPQARESPFRTRKGRGGPHLSFHIVVLISCILGSIDILPNDEPLILERILQKTAPPHQHLEQKEREWTDLARASRSPLSTKSSTAFAIAFSGKTPRL
jgi:hypothetical protein